MNVEVIKLIFAFLISLLVIADIIASIMPITPGKRELREELRYEKTQSEKERQQFHEDVKRLKKKVAELEKQVEFYKTESGYYKEQAEKNLELLRKALENGKQKHNV